MTIESIGSANSQPVSIKSPVAVEKQSAEVKAQMPSSADRVTISSEARALFQRSQSNETSPLSAGGTTLPPWPPSSGTGKSQDSTVEPLSAGGTTLPPWPPTKQS